MKARRWICSSGSTKSLGVQRMSHAAKGTKSQRKITSNSKQRKSQANAAAITV
jgi:cellobiose-specific phosphotransferase system component IIB